MIELFPNKTIILAAAQTKPKRGDIDSNLLDHYRLVELAAINKANLIVFPELSITGYERETLNKWHSLQMILV
jgi:predicted amidohydrolase